jgi:hypothetical protein
MVVVGNFILSSWLPLVGCQVQTDLPMYRPFILYVPLRNTRTAAFAAHTHKPSSHVPSVRQEERISNKFTSQTPKLYLLS